VAADARAYRRRLRLPRAVPGGGAGAGWLLDPYDSSRSFKPEILQTPDALNPTLHPKPLPQILHPTTQIANPEP